MLVIVKIILCIDVSMCCEGFVFCDLIDMLINQIFNVDICIIMCDLFDNLFGFVNEVWIGVNFIDLAEWMDDQKVVLVVLDVLIVEVCVVDMLVIGVLFYNFFVFGVLKVWIDMIVCVCEIFCYIENGLVGLLEGYKVYLVVILGGVLVGSDMDFVIGYMCYVMGFIGIIDVIVIEVGQFNFVVEEKFVVVNESIVVFDVV